MSLSHLTTHYVDGDSRIPCEVKFDFSHGTPARTSKGPYYPAEPDELVILSVRVVRGPVLSLVRLTAAQHGELHARLFDRCLETA